MLLLNKHPIMHAHCIQTPEEINCDSVDSATYKLPRPLNSSEDRQLLVWFPF